jgi:hypothetical protein
MLNVPAQMQPTLDRWKQTHSLGDGMKFGATGRASQYEQMMDQVVMADNQANDSAPESGLVVCKDDGETLRFQGDSKVGSLEATAADGHVVALNFTEKSVDFLQLTAKPEGVEALHEHYDRETGKGWMQIGGAVTVINMDEPGALEGIFGLSPSAVAPSASPQNSARAELLAQGLASKLEVTAEAVKVAEFSSQKGFNAGNCGFAVAGELQMSAWTEGLEVKFECDGQSYVYRGLDEKSGRYGQDVAHEGFWKQDERGIYVPDLSAPQEEIW